VIVSAADEQWEGRRPTAAVVQLLARRKAEAVAVAAGDALVIAADSLLDLGGEALGKPGSAEVARERWIRLSGARGTLCTGQYLLDAATGRAAVHLSETAVHFASPSDEEIAAYVGSGEPIEVAGAFTIDGLGSAFVTRVEGDASAVVGLSIAGLRLQLAELGVGLTELWRGARRG